MISMTGLKEPKFGDRIVTHWADAPRQHSPFIASSNVVQLPCIVPLGTDFGAEETKGNMFSQLGSQNRHDKNSPNVAYYGIEAPSKLNLGGRVRACSSRVDPSLVVCVSQIPIGPCY